MIHIAMLLDESGSMAYLRSNVVSTYNEYLTKVQKENKKVDAHIYLYTFDDSPPNPIVRTHLDIDLKKAKKITEDDYKPRGMTPLNDAVIKSIKMTAKKVSKKDKVLFVIYTDGLENASEASAQTVQSLVKRKQKDGWQFIYLGANQDAWNISAAYGLQKRGQTFTVQATPKGLRSTSDVLMGATTAYASVGDGGTLKEAEEALLKSTEKLGTKIDEDDESTASSND